MLTLILMRHAKSSWNTPELADHDRPLNRRGRDSATAMGRWLRRHGYLPGAVLSSSSRRTRETLDGLKLDAPVVFTRDLYHADPGDILRVLRGAQAPSLLILGHNPGIGEFAEAIVRTPPDHPRFEDYPTCATLVARLDARDWSEVGWGEAEVVDFAIPREVIADGT